jgi:hypothetical protein
MHAVYRIQLHANRPLIAPSQEDDHKFWDVLNPADEAQQLPAATGALSTAAASVDNERVDAEVMVCCNRSSAQNAESAEACHCAHVTGALPLSAHGSGCRAHMPSRPWPPRCELSSAQGTWRQQQMAKPEMQSSHDNHIVPSNRICKRQGLSRLVPTLLPAIAVGCLPVDCALITRDSNACIALRTAQC